MSKENRSRYLSIMGVARYVPRRMNTAADAETDLSPPRDKDSFQEPTPPTVERTAPVSAGESEIQIRLAFWQPSESLMIFDSLLPGQRPDRQRLDLLANIMKAINCPLDNPAEYELLDWPLAHQPPGNALGARTMLSAFLKARLQQCDSRWILLMGRCASRYILPDDSRQYEELLGRQFDLAGNARAIVVPGLTEMLGDRACKAQAWQALKFLSGKA